MGQVCQGGGTPPFIPPPPPVDWWGCYPWGWCPPPPLWFVGVGGSMFGMKRCLYPKRRKL